MITISWYFLILIAIITVLWIFTFTRDSSSGEGNRYGNNRRKSEESGRQRDIHHRVGQEDNGGIDMETTK